MLTPDVKIAAWLKTSLINFPGTVSTVLFLSGCSLRCPYCHNPEIVLDMFELVPFDDIKNHLIKRKGIVEGVVLTGGEPFLHDGLKGLCDELRGLGVGVKIDTNGLEPEKIIDCAPDYLAVDIKTVFPKYSLLNVSYHDHRERLARSVDIVKSMGQAAEVRITAAPGIIDTGDINGLCVELRGVKKLFIQPFTPSPRLLDPAYSSTKPYELSELEGWRKKFSDAGIDCHIRAG
ncbi:MAG: radical SAM protein [Chitinispirillales bacterium]|jgi:pyruvate formate lyase activating enzyme|nr:radical SAM protein [Chitinispirillales bacterium]